MQLPVHTVAQCGCLKCVYIPDVRRGPFQRCIEVEATWEYGRKGEKGGKHINKVLTGHKNKDTQ